MRSLEAVADVLQQEVERWPRRYSALNACAKCGRYPVPRRPELIQQTQQPEGDRRGDCCRYTSIINNGDTRHRRQRKLKFSRNAEIDSVKKITYSLRESNDDCES